MEILNRDTNQEIKLEIRNLCKTFDGKEVLKNISFDVKKGEFLGVLGLSGCGKTTLVRILIGLEKKIQERY
ncbi:MAG: ATP-binding cassette domain-containing protein [Clostridiaceae bacterium]|nr:ATP-binding cassette domain-containing protein [Clostridiaceae bacterium]